ncbi:hypothetical protein D3C74_412520 [compost metagenome]
MNDFSNPSLRYSFAQQLHRWLLAFKQPDHRVLTRFVLALYDPAHLVPDRFPHLINLYYASLALCPLHSGFFTLPQILLNINIESMKAKDDEQQDQNG